MAEDFSLEDILKEYSDRVPGHKADKPIEQKKPAEIEKEPVLKPESVPAAAKVSHEKDESPENENTAREKASLTEKRPVVSEETVGLQIKLGVKPQSSIEPVVSAAEEDTSSIEDISVTALVEKAVEEIEEEPSAEKNDDKNGRETESDAAMDQKVIENTAAIEKIVRMKRKRVVAKKQDNDAEQIKRSTPKDVHMDLTGKIIPQTEQLDKSDIEEAENEARSAEDFKKKRQEKINKFVLKESAESDNIDEDYEEGEYNSFDQTEEVAADIENLRSKLFVRFIILAVTALAAGYISVANDFSLPILGIFDKTTSPGGFTFTLTALGLVACFVGYNVIFAGLKNLVSMRADSDSLVSAAMTASVLSGIITLADEDLVRTGYFHIYIASAILGLMINTLGKLFIVYRTERNFAYVSGEYDKYALCIVSDEETAYKFTNGAVTDYPCLAAMRKTEFVKDFLKNSYASDIADAFSKKVSPFVVIGCVVVALLGGLIDRNASGVLGHIVVGLAVLSGALAMCSAVATMLAVNVPLARASKKYLQASAVIEGYSAVEDYADTNAVLVGMEQLFPEGMVELVNLKATSTTMIEECILLAGSLACQAGSVLKPTFYKILKGKTDMLYPVESYIYEDGQGLSGWIENKRILLGTRELMENHSIEGLPNIAKEREYARGNLVVYLSISGVVSSLFVIRAKASAGVGKSLRELEKNGVTVILKSVDAFISLNLLSRLFDVSPDMFKLLPFRFYKDYERETAYTPKMSASMLCSGHFRSLAMLITGVKKLQILSFVGVTIQAASIVLGGVIALIMALLGSFSQLTASVVLCYNIVWTVVTLLVQQLRKVS